MVKHQLGTACAQCAHVAGFAFLEGRHQRPTRFFVGVIGGAVHGQTFCDVFLQRVEWLGGYAENGADGQGVANQGIDEFPSTPVGARNAWVIGEVSVNALTCAGFCAAKYFRDDCFLGCCQTRAIAFTRTSGHIFLNVKCGLARLCGLHHAV